MSALLSPAGGLGMKVLIRCAVASFALVVLVAAVNTSGLAFATGHKGAHAKTHKPAAHAKAHGSLTASGDVSVTLQIDASLDCPNQSPWSNLMVSYLFAGLKKSTDRASEPALEFAVKKAGKTSFPSADSAATFFYKASPSAVGAYSWSTSPSAGFPGPGTGSVSLKSNKTGSFSLTLNPTQGFQNNLATSVETLTGSWTC